MSWQNVNLCPTCLHFEISNGPNCTTKWISKIVMIIRGSSYLSVYRRQSNVDLNLFKFIYISRAWAFQMIQSIHTTCLFLSSTAVKLRVRFTIHKLIESRLPYCHENYYLCFFPDLSTPLLATIEIHRRRCPNYAMWFRVIALTHGHYAKTQLAQRFCLGFECNNPLINLSAFSSTWCRWILAGILLACLGSFAATRDFLIF